MHSSLLDTPFGPVEYALHGEGFPILVSHGAAGGFDQSLLLAAPLAAEGFQLIAPSRDGYLRSAPTSPSSPTSPKSQADKYAWLLDRLGIDSCAVLGLSFGGASAIEFALSHARRCKALVLISAIVVSVRPAYLGALPEPLMLFFLRSAAYRFMLRGAPDWLLLRIFGITSKDERRVSSDTRAAQAIEEVLLAARDPRGLRADGTLADAASSRHLPRFAFADIQMPALAIHGSKDRFAPMGFIVQALTSMPQGRVEVIDGGGHLCILTHRDQIAARVTRFLRAVVNTRLAITKEARSD